MYIRNLFAITVLICCIQVLSTGTAEGQRPLRPSDFYRIRTISEPSLSPDGKWVAYSLSVVDSAKDKRISDLWMSSWDGADHVQLTHTPDGESTPKFSPDGKYLSFLSSRGNLDRDQIWLMDRRGGEAKKLTNIKGDIDSYEWSPDGKLLLLVIRELERPDSLKDKSKNPIVINRIHFKQDREGYRIPLYRHLFIYSVETGKLDTLTRGKFDNHHPVWSPDGKQVVFVSNHTPDPDKNDNDDLWVMEAKKDGAVRQLTTWQGYDHRAKWSPDGKKIAFQRSSGTGNFLMYEYSQLCTINADGSNLQVHTAVLDRDAHQHVWSKDGSQIYFLVSDDRMEYLSVIDLGSNKITKLKDGELEFTSLDSHPDGSLLAMVSYPNLPEELYAYEAGALRRITRHQDDFVKGILFSSPKGFTSKSKDGTLISNILYPPPGAEQNKNLSTIFFIHGGPVGQDTYGFDMSRQLLAARGYAVVAVNYRGSNGRGDAFTKAIWSDWGNKEVVDIFGSADHLVREGIADPSRLGIGGWSYGGILTNYCIASDPLRFKVAASGAGSGLQLSVFGVDQYITQYENELGLPWKSLDKYLKLSYPFLKADRIKTPTLFMTGEKDFNVPAVGSEQMYQALRVQGIPTELIVYPNQYHSISLPSYQVDQFTRYYDWFGKYLPPIGTVKINTTR